MSDTEFPIDGHCDERFARVRDAFVENFASRDELGAGVCVYVDGEKVVDLWGGHVDLDRTRPWREDTLVNMASVTKGMTALCMHILADRGEVDLDATMATYWPEFAQAGKQAITVRQTLGHNDGVIFNDAAPEGSWLDWQQMTEAIAAQEPAWPPGTQGAYNSHNYGYLIGEPIRRVSGRTPGVFFREEIAEPLGVDYHIGLTQADLVRVTDLNPNPKSTTLNAFKDPSTNLARAWHRIPKDGGPSPFNRRDYRVKEFPSGNGHGNARAVARVYAALARGGEIAGENGNVRVWSEDAVRRMAELQWESECGMTHRPFRMGLGLFLNSPPLQSMGPNMNAFGHMGAGGAFGFADPERRLAFSYSPNFMCEGAGVGARCEALVEATFASV
jgi:CubicO group peptidase (beta-lactamase class C family)